MHDAKFQIMDRQRLLRVQRLLFWVAFLIAYHSISLADPRTASGEMYYYIDGRGTIHFTNAPTDSRFTRLTPHVIAPRLPVLIKDLELTINRHAFRQRIDPALVRAIIKAESDFDPGAVSRAGASGLMQLMPQTAARLGVRNLFDPEENVGAGARYFRYLLDRYDGDITLALAAYNAGEHRVDRYQALPPIHETRQYVKKVLRFYRAYSGEFSPNVSFRARTRVAGMFSGFVPGTP
ncbi:MAG: lytic transglycosylase domain-containing protein [Nitrospiraceae bacterium]